MDYREEYVNSLMNHLCSLSLEQELLVRIQAVVYIYLDKYELSPRSTELIIRDTETDRILKGYVTYLTIDGKSENTIQEYIALLKRFSSEINRPLLKATVSDIRIWLFQKQTKLSMRTCENYRSYLSAFFHWLFSEGYISSNPMEKINRIPYEDVVRSPFSDLEIDALRGSCQTLRERAEIELLLSSGIRATELCSLDISDVNFHEMTVHVRKGKGNKQRNVYINALTRHYLELYLKSRKDENPALFITRVRKRLSKGALEEDL